MDKQSLEKLFTVHGMTLIGVVPLRGNDRDFFSYKQWLSQGKNAGMAFLERYLDIRERPETIEPGMVQTLVFGLKYFQGDKLRSGFPRVAQYARMSDYHKVMKKKGELIVNSLRENCPDLRARVTVDSAPILERSLAAKSSKGFIGKNTCYIHPDQGSFFLLGEVHLDHDLFSLDTPAQVDPANRGVEGGCGTCKRCQVNCPTGALDQEYQLDANLCLSYWSIEHRGLVPKKFWKWFKDYWFGCDICQLACPYNRGIPSAENLPLKENLRSLDLAEVAMMDQDYYEKTFGGSPMTRAKLAGLRRNAIIAMVSSEDERLDKVIRGCLEEESCPDLVIATIEQINSTCDTCIT